MSRFTVLGGRGFIGRRLVQFLVQHGHEVAVPARHDDCHRRKLGHVIYAIGVTHDFRHRPLDTVTAHVSRLTNLLAEADFDSLVYLSSTRVYQGLSGVAGETDNLLVNPTRPGDLYNLSKLAGESVALASGRPVRVVRISNVYHATDRAQSFLPSIVRSALSLGHVHFEAGRGTTRDYVHLDDVVAMLPRIALGGRHTVYNLASGVLVSHAELAQRVARLANCKVDFAPGAVDCPLPRISISRLQSEFGFCPRLLANDLPGLIDHWRAAREPVTC